MLKKLFFFLCLSSSSLFGEQLPLDMQYQTLVRDVKEIDHVEMELPRNYRSTKDHILIDEEQLGQIELRLDGLKEVPMGGTAQFTEAQLREIVSHWNNRIVVVDLREETHLILETAEGRQIPISAFMPLNVGNEGKSIDEIDFEHLRYKQYILERGAVALPYGKGMGIIDEDAPVFEVSNVYTEKEVVEKLGQTHLHEIQYVYLPVTDHKKPTPQIVDSFLDVMRNLQDDEVTLIFHCRAGRGRTGMMMVMRDMLENAKKYQLTFDQILKRQELLGSPNFADVSEGKEEQSIERFEFLNHFYQFVLAEDGYQAHVPYTNWLEKHPLGS